jgi:hypothetical protein
MNNTQTSFFIRDCSKGLIDALPVSRAGERSLVIYHIIGTIKESFEQATRRLLRLAELAHGQRDYVALQELSSALATVPFAPAQRAARYYQAILAKRAGHLDAAQAMLESISAPRAVQTLATIHEAKGEFDDAARLHIEAMRAAQSVDPLTIINASIQLSAIKSIAGDHHAALLDLKNISPLVRAFARLHPHLWFQLHNELAVELAATRQTVEARAAVAVAVAAPIVQAYPEWQATAAELAKQDTARIVVAVVQAEQGSDAAPVQITLVFTTHRATLPYSLFTDSPTTRALNPRASPRAPPFVNLK